MTTNREKAQALLLNVIRSDDDAQRRIDLEALQALKRSAKTSYEKLGVSEHIVKRELDALAHREAIAEAIAADIALVEKVAPPIERFPDRQLTRVFDPANYGIEATGPFEVVELAACPPVLKFHDDKRYEEESAHMGVDPLDEPVPAPQPKLKPKSDTRGDQRGLISAMVRCQLMDTADSYAVIVERVKAKFPEANTTTRSVASVAADLRKDGIAVASRRQVKGG